MTRIIELNKNNLNRVIEITTNTLKQGGLVVYPSDTVYGLLVDSTNYDAVEKLIRFKNRPFGKAISIFVHDISSFSRYLCITSDKIDLLMNILPGPFTIVANSKHKVQKSLESEKNTLGLRLPKYAPVIELIRKLGKPTTATSANLGGRKPHYSIQSLMKEMPKSKKILIDLIVDAGKLPRNKPSTVIDISGQKVEILRKGDMKVSKINSFISNSEFETQKIGNFIISSNYLKNPDKAISIILIGDLGTGKTEMTRGIAKYFGIDKIISPTFVVYYEYEIPISPRASSLNPSKFEKYDNKTGNNKFLHSRNINNFIHADLFNIEEDEEFEHLGLTSYLKPGNVLVVEWGEKLGSLIKTIQKETVCFVVEITHQGEKSREITIQKLNKLK